MESEEVILCAVHVASLLMFTELVAAAVEVAKKQPCFSAQPVLFAEYPFLWVRGVRVVRVVAAVLAAIVLLALTVLLKAAMVETGVAKLPVLDCKYVAVKAEGLIASILDTTAQVLGRLTTPAPEGQGHWVRQNMVAEVVARALLVLLVLQELVAGLCLVAAAVAVEPPVLLLAGVQEVTV